MILVNEVDVIPALEWCAPSPGREASSALYDARYSRVQKEKVTSKSCWDRAVGQHV